MTPIPKPRALRMVKAARDRATRKARKACVEAVFARAGDRCEWCGVRVYRLEDAPNELLIGHVHEPEKRSHGADPTDPAQAVLTCLWCHNAAHGV